MISLSNRPNFADISLFVKYSKKFLQELSGCICANCTYFYENFGLFEMLAKTMHDIMNLKVKSKW